MSLASLGDEAAQRDRRRIDARRARNEERRLRFLDARKRCMGVDVAALDAQVQERRARELAEKAADAAFANEQSQIRDIVEMSLQREMQDDTQRSRQIAQAQLLAKDPSLRREWDINNPRSLKDERRTTADDLGAVAGPSSMLVFDGEDRSKGNRVQVQRMQLRDWTEQVKAEKLRAAQAQKAEDDALAEDIRQIVEITGSVEAREAEERLAEAHRYAAANQILADDAKHRRQTRVMEDRAASERHVRNQIAGPFLSESRAAGVINGGRRYRRDQWKGMTTQQLAEIYAEQQSQMEEKKAIFAQKTRDDARFADDQATILDAMQQISQRELDESAALERQVRMAQAQQIVEKHERDRRDRAARRSAAITDDFFNKFGTSHR